MSWSFSVFISPALVVSHTLSHSRSTFFFGWKYTSNTGGLWKPTHKTDSIFLPFSLIRLIIYKCCLKTVVSVSIFLSFSFVSTLSFEYTCTCILKRIVLRLSMYIYACHSDYTQWLILSVCTSTLCYCIYQCAMVHLKWIWVQRNKSQWLKYSYGQYWIWWECQLERKLRLFVFGNKQCA